MPVGQQLTCGRTGSHQVGSPQHTLVGQAAHQAGIGPARAEAVAVDVDVLFVVHHAGAAVQAQGGPGPVGLGLVEPDFGLGVGHHLAQRTGQRCPVGQQPLQRVLGKSVQGVGNERRCVGGGLRRVFVQGGVFKRIGHAQGQFGCQAGALGHAKTHGIGHATLAHRDAVVGPAGGQVKHVAGFQHVFFFGHEIRQNFQGHIGLQAEVFLAADAPVAFAGGLQQKHVVAVKVRPHAATFAGPGNHQVVQPRIGHETEAVEELVQRIVVQIHPLHQQGPAGLVDGRKGPFFERPMAQGPGRTCRFFLGFASGLGQRLHDQARLHFVARGQIKQLRPREQGFETGNGPTHQQWLFLPVLFHELLGGQPTQQGERRVHSRRGRRGWEGFG